MTWCDVVSLGDQFATLLHCLMLKMKALNSVGKNETDQQHSRSDCSEQRVLESVTRTLNTEKCSNHSTHTHTTHTHTHSHTPHTISHTPTLSLTLTHTLSHTHKLKHTPTHTPPHIPDTHSHTERQTHTQAPELC